MPSGSVVSRRPDRSSGRCTNGWRPVAKRSAAKATLPGPKQVFRRFDAGVMAGDVVARADEPLPGLPLLVPAMRNGRSLLDEPLGALRARAADGVSSLPAALRQLDGTPPDPYRVELSPALRRLAERAGREVPAAVTQHGWT